MKEIDFRYDLLPLKNKLFRLALRITLDSAEAEDVVQDTFIKVWTKQKELQGINSLEAYCMTMCRNLSIDRFNKKEAQNVSLDETPVETTDHALLPDEIMEQQERLKKVQLLLSSLPEKQRTALTLREMEEKTYKETAEIMNITEENVKVLIHRARQTIRLQYDKIEKYGL